MQIAVVLVSFLAAYFVIKIVYERNWNKKLTIEMRFKSASAFEGEKMTLIETLINQKWLPLPWISVKFRISRNLNFLDESIVQGTGLLSDAYYRNDLFSIMMFQRIEREIPFSCKKRGFYSVEQMDLISSNIFASQKLVENLKCNIVLTVFPRLIDIDELTIPFRRLSGSVIAAKSLYPDPFEFRGIREYEFSDSLKSVNFKASARTGILMSNTYNHTVSQEIVIILNLQRYLTWSSELVFERSISIAASLASHYIGESVPVSFVSNGRDAVTGEEICVKSGSGSRHLSTIFESMARITFDINISALSEVIPEITTTSGNEPIYVLISPYCAIDMQNAYKSLRESSFDSLWIIPTLPADTEILKIDEIVREDIIKWEVKDIAPK